MLRVASRNASFHDGVLARALLAPLKLTFSLLLGGAGLLLAAWIVDWIVVLQVWPDGIARLRGILLADLAAGNEILSMRGWPPGFASGTANLFYELVFGTSGIHDMGVRFAEGAALSIPDTIVRSTYIARRDAIEVAMIGTQILGVRLATVVGFVPLLVLLLALGAADGWTQRAIRRASGGRESSNVYHRAKYWQLAGAGLGIVSMLLWPTAVDWWIGIAPLGIGLCILSRVQWTFYKKHL